MKKYIYCHRTNNNQYDDIAIVLANSKKEAINILLSFFNEVPMESVQEIKDRRQLKRNNMIQIISDY